MTSLEIENKHLDEQGKFDPSSVKSIRKITKLECYKSTLTQIDLSRFLNLKSTMFFQSNVELITNIPPSVEKIDIIDCQKIANLNLFGANSLKKIFFGRSSIQSLTNIPSSIEEIEIIDCQKITNLNLSGANSLKKIFLVRSSIQSLTNISPSVERIIIVDCPDIVNLDLLGANNLKHISFTRSHSITSITNLPDSLERIDLGDCINLRQNPILKKRLQDLEERGCVVSWPPHWTASNLIEEAKDRLDKIIDEYSVKSGQNPELFSRTIELLRRYMTEGVTARGEENITKEINGLLDIVEKYPENLEWIEKVSKTFLSGCVNQPVAGFNLIMSWMAVAQKESLSDKIEAVKRVKILSTITTFVGEELVKQKGGMRVVEVEAGNLLFIEVYNKLKKDGILQDDWIGVQPKISYQGAVEKWVKERINEAYNESVKILRSSKEDAVHFIKNYAACADVPNSDIFYQVSLNSPEIQEINDEYKKNVDLLIGIFEENQLIPDRFLEDEQEKEEYRNIQNQDGGDEDKKANDRSTFFKKIFDKLETKKESDIAKFIEDALQKETGIDNKKPPTKSPKSPIIKKERDDHERQ